MLMFSCFTKVSFAQTGFDCNKVIDQEPYFVHHEFLPSDSLFIRDVSILKHCGNFDTVESELLKSSVLTAVMREQVNAGKQYIGKGIRDTLINSVFTDEQVVLHLSPREKEVLQKVCSGRTIKEIAYDLKLSAHTVQYYHRSVMEKLKVKRTTDLIVYAMQHGLYIP